MICAIIYLETDADGTPVLVFDAIKDETKATSFEFEKAGRKESYGGDSFYLVPRHRILHLSGVAISPEAKAHFRARLEDKASYDENYHTGEIAIPGVREAFAYIPDQLISAFRNRVKLADLPTPAECGTVRRLRADERFTVCGTPRIKWLDEMIEADNEYLRTLDLVTPIDENILYKMYYEKKRREEGEPPTDRDTIRSTPAAFLTEAQREVIRADYRARCGGYSAQEWNETRDYDHGEYLFREVIVPALAQEYNKHFAEIAGIVKACDANG